MKIGLPEATESKKSNLNPFKIKTSQSNGQVKEKPKKNDATKEKRQTVTVRTNKRPRLVDLGLMRKHNFLSATEATMRRIYSMTHLEGSRYEVSEKEACVSATLKLVMHVSETNAMTEAWSLALWNITQRYEALPDGVMVTFSRHFERVDDDLARKKIKSRKRLSILSSNSSANMKRQGIFIRHDADLLNALDTGDSVIAFGAEAHITAPDDQSLEEALDAIRNYLASNDETRGLQYELDINNQSRPFLLYGPNSSSKNNDVFVNMTSEDAAFTGLFVDSGGDRAHGSEYVGVSVGKLIRSHAAYSFKNHTSMFIGNDTENKTYVISQSPDYHHDYPSQLYLSKVTSRAYLLDGQSVTHFVLDNPSTVDTLMGFGLNDDRKVAVDVSKGLLNILEAIDNGELKEHPERIISRFPTHISNIIALLTQFRASNKLSNTDDFASITRDILINFFVNNKYWSYGAKNNLSDLRLIGTEHSQFKRLSDFGQYVTQRKLSNTDSRLADALHELDTIINKNILPTIPALDTHTDPIVDKLVAADYRVIDLTGTSVGSMTNISNPTTNMMMISYLNLILPSLKNNDVIFIHGMSRIADIANVVQQMIALSGLTIDVVYTENNSVRSLETMALVENEFDFVMVDLYKNRVQSLVKPLGMDIDWLKDFEDRHGSFFIKTTGGVDYIYLDDIL